MDMKKGLFIGLLSLCITAMVSAQTATAPSAVSSAFNQAMPGTNATFTQEGTLWTANFTHNGKQVQYGYNAEGVLQYKETAIAKTEVPANILSDIEARFSNEPFEGVAKRELADGTVHYKYQYQSGGKHVQVFYNAATGQMAKRNVF